MYKRVRHIIMLFILLSGVLQALAQPYAMPDNVCVGTVRRYWVTPSLPNSFFTWKINGATQTSTVEFIDLNWSAAGVFNLQVQEHQINCDGDIQLGVITVGDFTTCAVKVT